jgi:hypothetical protein
VTDRETGRKLLAVWKTAALSIDAERDLLVVLGSLRRKEVFAALISSGQFYK